MNISWPALNEEILSCARCPLAAGIKNKVPGQGNQDARLMLIGEGPGAQEDQQGIAFIGAAGQLLTRMLAAIHLNRDEVFISNVVKCRPPNNRVPQPAEMEACLPYLRAQTALVRREILLLLGATAMQAVLGPGKRITQCRGQWTLSKGVFIMPTYHPAALLRDPSKKRDVWQDLQAVRAKLDEQQKEAGQTSE